MQGELFLVKEASPTAVPGLSLRFDYVTPEEEGELIARVDAGEWETDWRRRIQQYGLCYAGEHGTKANWLRALPEWLSPLAGRVAKDAGFEGFPRIQLLMNTFLRWALARIGTTAPSGRQSHASAWGRTS